MDQIRCWQEVLSDLQRGNAAAVTAEKDARATAVLTVLNKKIR